MLLDGGTRASRGLKKRLDNVIVSTLRAVQKFWKLFKEQTPSFSAQGKHVGIYVLQDTASYQLQSLRTIWRVSNADELLDPIIILEVSLNKCYTKGKKETRLTLSERPQWLLDV